MCVCNEEPTTEVRRNKKLLLVNVRNGGLGNFLHNHLYSNIYNEKG